MKRYFKEEQLAYKEAKAEFDNLGEHGRRQRYRSVFPDDYPNAPPISSEFMSFDDFMKHHESTSRNMQNAYSDLMTVPEKSDVMASCQVEDYLLKLDTQLGLSWSKLSSE